MEQKSEFCALCFVNFTHRPSADERRSPLNPLFDGKLRQELFEARVSNNCLAKWVVEAATYLARSWRDASSSAVCVRRLAETLSTRKEKIGAVASGALYNCCFSFQTASTCMNLVLSSYTVA